MIPFRVLASRVLLEKKWLKLREERLELPNGHIIEEFHLVESPDWVGAVALTPEREILLVDQYRHGLGRTSRELPAGVIDPGETPLQAAQRELLEETGHTAGLWKPLVVFSPEPNRSTHRAHFFLAEEVVRTGAPQPEKSEVLEVVKQPLALVLQEIAEGKMDHAAHAAAILLAARAGWLG